MNRRITYTLLMFPALCLTGLLLFSCSANEKQNTIIQQEESIDKYLSSTYPDSVVIRRNGSNKVITKHSHSGNVLEYGDTLYMYYAGFVFQNRPTMLFVTNWESVAQEYGFGLTDMNTDILKVPYSDHSFIPGLNDGLYGMREGEAATIVFSAKYGFGDRSVYAVPSLSALLYHVLILKIDK